MENPEIDQSATNPIKTRNRALDMRRDNDDVVIPSITIYDIDYAILYQLKEVIQPQITENGNLVNVPIKFADGELWAQIQRDGYLRDVNRNLILPLISIRRVSMNQDDRFPSLNVSSNNQANTLIIYPDTQKNNLHDLPRRNNHESYELYVTQIPQRVRINYELVVWAETLEHLNTIVETIIPNTQLPWGDSFQFVVRIEDYSFDVTNNAGEERAAKCTINLLVDGCLQNEFNYKESAIQKAYTIKRVVFKNEVQEDNLIVDYLPKEIKPSESRMKKRILERNS